MVHYKAMQQLNMKCINDPIYKILFFIQCYTYYWQFLIIFATSLSKMGGQIFVPFTFTVLGIISVLFQMHGHSIINKKINRTGVAGVFKVQCSI